MTQQENYMTSQELAQMDKPHLYVMREEPPEGLFKRWRYILAFKAYRFASEYSFRYFINLDILGKWNLFVIKWLYIWGSYYYKGGSKRGYLRYSFWLCRTFRERYKKYKNDWVYNMGWDKDDEFTVSFRYFRDIVNYALDKNPYAIKCKEDIDAIGEKYGIDLDELGFSNQGQQPEPKQ